MRSLSAKISRRCPSEKICNFGSKSGVLLILTIHSMIRKPIASPIDAIWWFFWASWVPIWADLGSFQTFLKIHVSFFAEFLSYPGLGRVKFQSLSGVLRRRVLLTGTLERHSGSRVHGGSIGSRGLTYFCRRSQLSGSRSLEWCQENSGDGKKPAGSFRFWNFSFPEILRMKFFTAGNFTVWNKIFREIFAIKIFSPGLFCGWNFLLPEISGFRIFFARKFSRMKIFTGTWTLIPAPDPWKRVILRSSCSAFFALNFFKDRKFPGIEFFMPEIFPFQKNSSPGFSG